MNMPLAADHKGIPLLAALDEQLATVLASGAITKLLRAEFLRADGSEAMLPKLLRRQELERMEEERGIRIFLTPEDAVAALRSLSRVDRNHPVFAHLRSSVKISEDLTGGFSPNLAQLIQHGP